MSFRWAVCLILLMYPVGCATSPPRPTVAERPDLALVRVERSGSTFSGFFVTADGVIVTTAAATAGDAPVQIITSDGRTFSADRVEEDAEDELAIVQVKGKEFPFLSPQTDDLEPGLAVRAITPGGVVRGVFEAWEGFGKTMSLSLRASPADAGSPVLNEAGKAIAILRGPVPGHPEQSLATPIWHVLRMMPSVGK